MITNEFPVLWRGKVGRMSLEQFMDWTEKQEHVLLDESAVSVLRHEQFDTWKMNAGRRQKFRIDLKPVGGVRPVFGCHNLQVNSPRHKIMDHQLALGAIMSMIEAKDHINFVIPVRSLRMRKYVEDGVGGRHLRIDVGSDGVILISGCPCQQSTFSPHEVVAMAGV